MWAPIATRQRARSWTCGSQAALRSTVRPLAITAAISAFSVPVTLGSSRKMSLPVSSLGLELVAVAHRDRGAQLLERQEVGVDPAPADDVSAGRRERDLAEAGEQRSGQQDRGADPGAERRVERLGPHPSRVDPHQIGAGPLGRGPEIHEDREHGLDVPDARDVVELHRTVGEDGGGEDRKRRVLVAGGTHGTAQRSTAAHEEAWRHGQSSFRQSDASSGARGLREASYHVVFSAVSHDPCGRRSV